MLYINSYRSSVYPLFLIPVMDPIFQEEEADKSLEELYTPPYVALQMDRIKNKGICVTGCKVWQRDFCTGSEKTYGFRSICSRRIWFEIIAVYFSRAQKKGHEEEEAKESRRHDWSKIIYVKSQPFLLYWYNSFVLMHHGIGALLFYSSHPNVFPLWHMTFCRK